MSFPDLSTHFSRKFSMALTTGFWALYDDLHINLGLQIQTQMGKSHPDF